MLKLISSTFEQFFNLCDTIFNLMTNSKLASSTNLLHAWAALILIFIHKRLHLKNVVFWLIDYFLYTSNNSIKRKRIEAWTNLFLVLLSNFSTFVTQFSTSWLLMSFPPTWNKKKLSTISCEFNVATYCSAFSISNWTYFFIPDTPLKGHTLDRPVASRLAA
jgi:hypothetical protein